LVTTQHCLSKFVKERYSSVDLGPLIRPYTLGFNAAKENTQAKKL